MTKKSIFALFVLCAMIFAQDKMAVYVSEHSEYSPALRTATLNALVRSGKYDVIERSDVIDKERSKQTSGEIDDDQLTAFGKQLGAQYICIADAVQFGTINSSKSYQVSVRIIDVETAEVIASGIYISNINNIENLTSAVNKAIAEMFKGLDSIERGRTDLPNIAIYIQNNANYGSRNLSNALYTFVLSALFDRSRANGDFKVVERSDAFTRQIDRELSKQRNGSVANEQISRMGKQYGIVRILVANIDYAENTYSISSRLVDVKTAKVLNASELRHLSSISSLDNLQLNSIEIVEDIIKRRLTKEEIKAIAVAEREAEERRKEALKAIAVAKREAEERRREELKAIAAAKREAEERRKEELNSWQGAFTIGGGVKINMGSVDSNFTSLGGLFNLNVEFYKGSFDFFHLGTSFSMAGAPNRETIRKIYPNADSIEWTPSIDGNIFLRLYPAEVFYLSGGIGFFYNSLEFNLNDDKISGSVSGMEFPVGIGLVLGNFFVFEGIYHIVPDKNSGYFSVSAGIKVDSREGLRKQAKR